MYPPLLDDAGLGPALNWYIRGFAERSGVKASVEIKRSFGRYPQEIETAIFCIVQEALTNVHRYSGSPTVVVRLGQDDSSIHAEIEDHGCGLPILSPMRGKTPVMGVGIAGMRERVKQLNGSFEIISTPGSGTVVRAILPIPRQQQPASKAGLASEIPIEKAN
jgi:signal transduction histidine kinase